MIPAVLLLIQTVVAVFGFEININDIADKLLDVVNAAFVVLAIMGIVTDQTTEGIADSEQALTYEQPKSKDGGQNENH